MTAVYLAAMMFSVGLGLRAHRQATPATRGRTGLRVRALLLNLVLIPGVAVMLTRALHLAGDVASALILVALSPGGRFAPHLVRRAAGNVTLATAHLILFAHFAVFSAPLMTSWLLGLHHVNVLGARMVVQGFLLQILPLYAGDLFARRRGDLAQRWERALRPVVAAISATVVVVLVIESGPASVEILADRGWIAVGAVAAAAMTMGWLLAGRDRETRRAFVIGALSRNVALALLLAGLAFPRTRTQLAVFGAWWILLGAGYVYAWIAPRISATRRARE